MSNLLYIYLLIGLLFLFNQYKSLSNAYKSIKSKITNNHKNFAKRVYNLILFIICIGLVYLFYIYKQISILKNISFDIDFLKILYKTNINIRLNYMIGFTIVVLCFYDANL